jgi:SCO1/SenC family protein
MVAFLTQLLLAIRSRFARRARLEAENLLLRRQLICLRRQHPRRVRLWNIDRLLFVWLYRLYPSLLEAIIVVQPETVAMVSITTDPAEDKPAQLLKYAKAQGVDAEGFTFLTGKTRQIERLLALLDVPEDGPDEATTHVLDLFLISPDGAGMRKYNGMSVSAQALASDIRSSDSRH